MIGKITLATTLLVATAAFAQQTQTPGGSTTPPNTQNQNQAQCWDMATNQVRQRGTVGAGGNQAGANPTASRNQQAPSGSAAQRPAGMANC